MSIVLNFPKDFVKKPHPFLDVAWYTHESFSILLGTSAYSNGIDTYEMWDFREVSPRGYMTAEEINEHLKNNPI